MGGGRIFKVARISFFFSTFIAHAHTHIHTLLFFALYYPMKSFSFQEVAQHNSKDDLWIVLHGKVYDLTKFLPEHPGGQKIILKYAGKDATSAFDPIHPPDIIDRYLSPEVCLGKIHEAELNAVVKVETELEKKMRLAHESKPRLDEMYNTFDFESVAKSVLSPDAWAYYSSGADDEFSMRENHSAFHRIWMRPRVMVDVAKVDTSTTMLGTKCALPLYITATALGKLGHPDGEKVLTRAAGTRGIIQMIPTLASCSFDEIVNERVDGQDQWLQIYVNTDRNVTKRFMQHAESRGIKGFFVTVDAPQLGRREKDMRQKYSQQAPDEMDNETVGRDEGAARAISTFIDPSLNWKDIAWFKSFTNLPIIVKGIQTVEDAVLAAKYGCKGIIISNHGGRQLDFAPTSIEILPEVMDALKRERLDEGFEVYIDGGIRRGSDIIKAIALGAKGVGIGRPFLYAMAAYGQAGVERLMDIFRDEIEMNMRLIGAPTIADLKPEMMDIRNLKDHIVAHPIDHLATGVYERMHPRLNKSKL
ncbi:FMN-dependent dehydrogenase-domain-containing protein [Dichotomocladium elegans]|nr:FMN-dependent dehydrogenase-domain-containing protein [Dichotomocladium elegans]